MNVLELFAGAGGSILASELLGWRSVCAVESDPYCREVLMARQEDGTIAPFPIWDDVRTFDGRPWREVVDLVTAGFPCQPFSLAGHRKGADDDRNLWPDTARILREVRPRFALLENVPGLVSSGYLGAVLGDLAAAGFDAQWDCVSAGETGAPHKRDRLWILATDTRRRRPDGLEHKQEPRGDESPNAGAARARARTDAGSERCEGRAECDREQWPWIDGTSWDDACGHRVGEWFPKALAIAQGMDDGLAHRVDRLRALGNGWVPRVAVLAWSLLSAQAREEVCDG